MVEARKTRETRKAREEREAREARETTAINVDDAAESGAELALDHFYGDAIAAGAQSAAEAVIGEGVGAAAFGGTLGSVPGAIVGFVAGKVARKAYNYMTEVIPTILEEALPNDYIAAIKHNKKPEHYVTITLVDKD